MAFFDTYHKVMSTIELSISGEEIALDDLLKEIALLFHEFQIELSSSDEAGCRELIKLMNVLHQKLEEHGKMISARLGISPEVLQNVAEREENFSPSQFAWIQKAKENIEAAGERISSFKKDESQDTEYQPDMPKSSKKAGKRPKRSDWKRS